MKVRWGSAAEHDIEAGESILDLARRVGFPLAAGCFNGGCGVCKIHVATGSIRLSGPLSRRRVSEQEEAQGYTLACRAIPETDVVIDQYCQFRRLSAWQTKLELISL